MGPFLELFQRAARDHGVDPQLLWAVAMAESSLNPQAVSATGALGLMQLMPETAQQLGCHDPLDPEQNVQAGARYLRQLLDQFGDVALALAAYNAGPPAVERYGGVPPYRETQDYVRRVLDLWEQARSAPWALSPLDDHEETSQVQEEPQATSPDRQRAEPADTAAEEPSRRPPSFPRSWLRWWRRRP